MTSDRYQRMLAVFECGKKGTLGSRALLFFIILAPSQELDKTRTDSPQGMTLVGLALAGLLLLGRRTKRAQTA